MRRRCCFKIYINLCNHSYILKFIREKKINFQKYQRVGIPFEKSKGADVYFDSQRQAFHFKKNPFVKTQSHKMMNQKKLKPSLMPTLPESHNRSHQQPPQWTRGNGYRIDQVRFKPKYGKKAKVFYSKERKEKIEIKVCAIKRIMDFWKAHFAIWIC